MIKSNIFLFYLVAPLFALLLVGFNVTYSSGLIKEDTKSFNKEISDMQNEIDNLTEKVTEIKRTAEKQEEVFNEQNKKMTELMRSSQLQKKMSDDIYEQKILKILGQPIDTHMSSRSEIKIFKLTELGYRGYIAKVKLFDAEAFKVVLAKDALGEKETTSTAGKRTNAVLAINGGGFYMENRNGKEYAQLSGNTVINGKLVQPFIKNTAGSFVAGINKNGQVIGTVPRSHSELFKIQPYQAVSFIPILLKEGKKLDIPKDWKESKNPRTIIGKYANDDLILIVIDGRQGRWSQGVSLERLQNKLLELGVKDAYNLDGGGSSAMYYKGKILNRPSDGKERPVVNNIVIF
ncbi:phosphodiester glycosidase family protein [Oceanirhabdus sp. W0125-5]|uniref:phosphodiester glycosidase family protein n=1 Tax=Oceanirhabdus sp. W0125-5 TaxID=2999116 RepID=UPI0022F2B9DA|nr:phosphodiester glycosidase family protein [Oceanirhabdus sp. W0125-5]WBW96542.1 phosphodiester glycosidase family protein [Oceanirhabdus sp. W0125-5]